jgi:hypothetical protein
LFRDASPLEREIFAEFVLKKHLADAILIVENGVQIWSWHTQELAGEWAPAVELELVPAPEGLSVDCGLWVDESGTVTALTRGEGCPFEFPWEREPAVREAGDDSGRDDEHREVGILGALH